MTNSLLVPLTRYLRKMVDASQVADTEDGNLLERYATHRDETAFAVLVQRYGPLVFGLCRRILQDEQDTEDAFQATFLVLVRKATRISKSTSVGSWLYGVAYRVALRVKADRFRRQARDQRGEPRQTAEPANELMRDELRAILDDEVNR